MKGHGKRQATTAYLRLASLVLLGMCGCVLMACRRSDEVLSTAPPIIETLSDTLWDHVPGVPGTAGVSCLAPYRSGEILAGTDIGVYRSTDGGYSWTWMSGNSPTLWGIRALCSDIDGSVYASVRSPEKLLRYKNPDSGWTTAANGLETSTVLSIAIDSSGILFCGMNGTGVYRSTDRSVSWEPLTDGMGSVVVQILRLNGKGDLFAGTSPDGVFRLHRGSAFWSGITELPSSLLVRAIGCDALGRMMLSAGESVYRSFDNGDNWELCPGKPGTPQILALLLIPPSTAYVGTNNGVYQSADNGNTWAACSLGLDHQPVYALMRNSGGLLIAGTLNGIYRTRR